MDLVDRLNLALKSKGKSQMDLARACKISRQAMGAVFQRIRPGLRNVDKYAKFLDVDVEWLTTGDPAHQPSWLPVMTSDVVPSLKRADGTRVIPDALIAGEHPLAIQRKNAEDMMKIYKLLISLCRRNGVQLDPLPADITAKPSAAPAAAHPVPNLQLPVEDHAPTPATV